MHKGSPGRPRDKQYNILFNQTPESMKATKLTVMILFLSMAMAACGGNNNKNNNAKDNAKMETIELTKAEFLKKIHNYETTPNEWKFLGDKPAIIDFYATWCGPCKALAPVMEELSKEYAGKVDIYKVDVDKEQELAAAFGVRSIPTLIFIPMSGQPTLSQGALPKSQLKEIIDNTLLKK